MQKTPLLVFFALGLLPIALQAATLGLPPTAPYSTGSVELYWERYRTDIEQEFRLSGGQTFIGEQRENRWVGRSTFRAGDNWLVHALSGGTDSEASTGSVPLIGLGTEWTAWEKNKSGISWVASIEYAHGITYRRPPAEIDGKLIAGEKRKESHWDALLGIRASTNFSLSEKLAVIPYLSLYLNWIEASAEEHYRFPTGEGGGDRNVDFEQDGIIGTSMGAIITFPSGWYARGEASFIDRASFSLGLGWGF